jgi:hypothetical protein
VEKDLDESRDKQPFESNIPSIPNKVTTKPNFIPKPQAPKAALNTESKPYNSQNNSFKAAVEVEKPKKKEEEEDEYSDDSYKMDFDDVKEEFRQPFGAPFGKKFGN